MTVYSGILPSVVRPFSDASLDCRCQHKQAKATCLWSNKKKNHSMLLNCLIIVWYFVRYVLPLKKIYTEVNIYWCYKAVYKCRQWLVGLMTLSSMNNQGVFWLMVSRVLNVHACTTRQINVLPTHRGFSIYTLYSFRKFVISQID